MSTPNSFDVGAFQRRYTFVDQCPEKFLPHLVRLTVGSLEQRVSGLLSWRTALLEGRLPPEDTWPPRGIAGPARQALTTLGLVRFCKGHPELVDALLKDVLESFVRSDGELQSAVADQLAELEKLERRRLETAEADLARKEKRPPREVQIDGDKLDRLRKKAARMAAEREVAEDAILRQSWEERARAWAEISEVFGDLGELMGRGWDLSQGVLRHTGWKDLLRLRALIAQLPELREIVRSLGRLQVSDTEETVASTVFVPVRRLEEERREVRTPNLPAETRGIERSGEIARMLPGEAVNLGHPKLRYLWHARRAERALMTYRIEGIEIERVWVEQEGQEPIEQRAPRPQRGPIIAVVDTSGSMHGLPERVAKALVLEALRTANAEKRRCFLYVYSGPGQIAEHELDLSQAGIGRLLAFLALSFGGGNDEAGVLQRVINRLELEQWKKADVVFVSDGEWPAPTTLLHAVARARESGTRFHGVQIGNRGQTGLHAVCDPVHVFRDWATAGGWNR